MILPPQPPGETLSPSEGSRLDHLCSGFELAWHAASGVSAGQPRIEDYLAQVTDTQRPNLLCDLILVDLYYRRRAGEQPRMEDYQARFPGLALAWLAAAVELYRRTPATAANATLVTAPTF